MKETSEEAAEKYAEIYRCPATNKDECCRHDIISAVNFGIKLAQERMYSDIQEYAEFCVQCFIKNLPCITAKTWFEQNKKK